MNATPAPAVVRFTDDDLDLFSAASHDRNPLHLSAAYARRTAFGQRVVFGVLGGLACLSHLQPQDKAITRLTMEFLAPMFVGIDYTIQSTLSASSEQTISLCDGQNVLVKAIIEFAPTSTSLSAFSDTNSGSEKSPIRSEAAQREIAELTPQLEIRGDYAPPEVGIQSLMRRWNLENPAEVRRVAALLWCSYLVGMELPGQQALFTRLSLQFSNDESNHASWSYHATVRSFDKRFDLLKLDVELGAQSTLMAHGELWSFVRRPSASIDTQRINEALPPSNALAGKVALVIGGSRGLGAAITQTLALQGATVLVNYWKSAEEVQRLQNALPDCQIVALQGDGGDLAWCRKARDQILRDFGRLDFLICNAYPALLPLQLDENSIERINEFLQRAFPLVSVPTAVFGGDLVQAGGCHVLISSEAVDDPPAEWPHYVAAKYATEGLLHVAAKKYPAVRFVIARPPRLSTDLTNTPRGWQNTQPPELVAAAIVRHLINSSSGQSTFTPRLVQLLTDFP